jgi:hypothetical protein
MRSGWRALGLLLLFAALATLSTGCSGVNATGTVSPLMFLVPGLGQTGPAPGCTPVTATPSPEPVQILAQSY